MDDELASIQQDLDDVLERLTAYMVSDRLVTPYTDPQDAIGADAAHVIFNYVHSSELEELDKAIHQHRQASEYWHDKDEEYLKENGREVGLLMAAISALAEWDIFGRAPLEQRHLAILSRSAMALQENVSEYFGQEVGLQLKAKRSVDRRKFERHDAAQDVWALHVEDPNNNPIGEELFERVGLQYGMSASSVKRAYYSDQAKYNRRMHEALISSLSKTSKT